MDPLSQQAQQASLDAYNEAVNRQNEAAQRYFEVRGQERPSDSSAGKQYDLDYHAAETEFNTARAAVAKASSDYAALTGRLAIAYEAKQHSAKDPNQQQMWANEAAKAHAQADLYGAQSSMYAAKTQSEIDSAGARAEAALSRAKTYAQNSQSLGGLRDAQTALANEKLAFLPALSQSTIQLHQQQIETGAAHAKLYAAQTAKTEAQANLLIPAQADYYVARGILTQAQAEQLKVIGPIKADELEAKLGLDKARADLIRSQIGRYQLAPAQDRNLPTLTEFQPSTGQVAGIPNPSYVNPETQPIKDAYSAIDQVQSMLAQGQIQPADADQLMANLRQSLDARTRGFTPEQYEQTQQAQANFGAGLLNNMIGRGQQQAGDLSSIMRNARSMPEGLTPYSNGFAMGGGLDMARQALSLIQQIQPINDRGSAFDAAAKYGQAGQMFRQAIEHLQGGGGGGGGDTPAQSQPTPSQDTGNPNDQADQQAAARDSSLSWLFNSPASPISNPANTGAA